MKSFSEEELDETGTHLAQLACGKGRIIFREFWASLDDPAWDELTTQGIDAAADQAWLRQLAAAMILTNAGGFYRRISRKVVAFPHRLMLLVDVGMNEPSSE
eukprot:6586979-Pyramimonas_sp.AAC.1